MLNGLIMLDPPVAASLAKRSGNRKANRAGTLVINGLSSLSAETAAALSAFPGELVLKGITELDAKTAAALASHKGRLQRTGLTRLDPMTLVSFRGHPNLLLPRPLPGDILKLD